MKIKFWQFECDFNKDDSKIAIPVVLLALSLNFTKFNAENLIVIAVVYYFFYFLLEKIVNFFKDLWNFLISKRKHKCPKCKSNKIILQGYSTYKSDEHHAFYLCTKCEATSLLTEGGLSYK